MDERIKYIWIIMISGFVLTLIWLTIIFAAEAAAVSTVYLFSPECLALV